MIKVPTATLLFLLATEWSLASKSLNNYVTLILFGENA